MNNIPTLTNFSELQQYLATTRVGLGQVLRKPSPPNVVFNLAVSSQQGGNYLTWSQTKGADGYIVEISTNGDFSDILTSTSLDGIDATAYFDAVPTATGSAPPKRYYRVRATSGTQTSPRTIVGKASGAVASSAIAPNDTVTASTTTRDTSNLDLQNTKSADGDYRVPPRL